MKKRQHGFEFNTKVVGELLQGLVAWLIHRWSFLIYIDSFPIVPASTNSFSASKLNPRLPSEVFHTSFIDVLWKVLKLVANTD